MTLQMYLMLIKTEAFPDARESSKFHYLEIFTLPINPLFSFVII